MPSGRVGKRVDRCMNVLWYVTWLFVYSIDAHITFYCAQISKKGVKASKAAVKDTTGTAKKLRSRGAVVLTSVHFPTTF